MNMKQLRYVLVLAEEGNFSRAADSLSISQPSLSQYIRKIEKDLGVTLFDRSGGEVRTTDAGKVYIDAGRKILDLERQMTNQFEDLSAHKAGSIVVGVSPYRSVHLLPEIVNRFRKKYPGMHLIIEERTGGRLLEDAEHGAFDLCIATLPVDERKFVFERVGSEEILVAVNRDSDLYKRLRSVSYSCKDRRFPVIDAYELNRESFVMLSETQPIQRHLMDLCYELGIEVTTAVECRTIDTQFAMVQAGVGAALLPSSLLTMGNVKNVACFSLQQELPCRDIAVVYRRDQYISRPTRELIEVIKGLDFF